MKHDRVHLVRRLLDEPPRHHRAFLLWHMCAAPRRKVTTIATACGVTPRAIRKWRENHGWDERANLRNIAHHATLEYWRLYDLTYGAHDLPHVSAWLVHTYPPPAEHTEGIEQLPAGMAESDQLVCDEPIDPTVRPEPPPSNDPGHPVPPPPVRTLPPAPPPPTITTISEAAREAAENPGRKRMTRIAMLADAYVGQMGRLMAETTTCSECQKARPKFDFSKSGPGDLLALAKLSLIVNPDALAGPVAAVVTPGVVVDSVRVRVARATKGADLLAAALEDAREVVSIVTQLRISRGLVTADEALDNATG